MVPREQLVHSPIFEENGTMVDCRCAWGWRAWGWRAWGMVDDMVDVIQEGGPNNVRGCRHNYLQRYQYYR
jgi:hypothetical protein